MRLILYGDDFGVVNPIGPSKSHQKIFALYLDIENRPANKRSKTQDIPALIFSNRLSIKVNNIDTILKPLIQDIIRLQVSLLVIDYI